MGDIYVQEEGKRVRFVPCTLTHASADYHGKSLWEIDPLRKEDRRQMAANSKRSSFSGGTSPGNTTRERVVHLSFIVSVTILQI